MKKITYRLPTTEYAYIEIEHEVELDVATEAIVAGFRELQEAYNGGEGMTEAELDLWVENMLLQKGNNADVYKKATPAQQKELHRLKRAISRIKSRNHVG